MKRPVLAAAMILLLTRSVSAQDCNANNWQNFIPSDLVVAAIGPSNHGAFCSSRGRNSSQTDREAFVAVASGAFMSSLWDWTGLSFGPEGARRNYNSTAYHHLHCSRLLSRQADIAGTMVSFGRRCEDYDSARSATRDCLDRAQVYARQLCEARAGETQLRQEREERRRREQEERRERAEQQQREQRERREREEQQQREQRERRDREAQQQREQRERQEREAQQRQEEDQRRRSDELDRIREQQRIAEEERRRRAEEDQRFRESAAATRTDFEARAQETNRQQANYEATLGTLGSSLLAARGTGSHYQGPSWRLTLNPGLGMIVAPYVMSSQIVRRNSRGMTSSSSRVSDGGGVAMGLSADVGFFPIESRWGGLGIFGAGFIGGLFSGAGSNSSSTVYGEGEGGVRMHIGHPRLSLIGEASVGWAFLERKTSDYGYYEFASPPYSETTTGRGGGGRAFIRAAGGLQTCFTIEHSFCDWGLAAGVAYERTEAEWGPEALGAFLTLLWTGFGQIRARVYWEYPSFGVPFASQTIDDARGYYVGVSILKSFEFFGARYGR